jgi:hypothetical protein
MVGMGLTDEERRRLGELAEDLARDDPQLGRALSGGLFRGRRSLAAAVLLAAVSPPLAVFGVTLTQPLLFTAASISLMAAAWIAVRTGYRRYSRRRRDRGA